MSEYAKLRYTQDYFLLRILPVTAVETPKKCNKIFRTLIVKVREHVYDCELILGQRYSITGYFDYRRQSQVLQAWNLAKI